MQHFGSIDPMVGAPTQMAIFERLAEASEKSAVKTAASDAKSAYAD